jgi:hypothetical protein
LNLETSHAATLPLGKGAPLHRLGWPQSWSDRHRKKWKFFTLLGPKFWPLSHPAHSQLLYRLGYPSFYFLKIHLNIIPPMMFSSPSWYLSLQLYDSNIVHISQSPCIIITAICHFYKTDMKMASVSYDFHNGRVKIVNSKTQRVL